MPPPPRPPDPCCPGCNDERRVVPSHSPHLSCSPRPRLPRTPAGVPSSVRLDLGQRHTAGLSPNSSAQPGTPRGLAWLAAGMATCNTIPLVLVTSVSLPSGQLHERLALPRPPSCRSPPPGGYLWLHLSPPFILQAEKDKIVGETAALDQVRRGKSKAREGK